MTSASAQAPRREIARLILFAVLVRLMLLWRMGSLWRPIDVGEASHAAVAFARTGTIADGFFPGQGPTAHMLPTTIVIAGAIHRLFGIESAAANGALVLWALVQMAIGFVLLRAVFATLGQDRKTLYAGLVGLCLVPVFLSAEAGEFRYWEGGLAVCLATLNLLWLLRLDRAPAAPGWRTLAGIAALSAVTLFVNPATGAGVDLCWAVFALRRLPWHRVAGFATLAALALALVIAPWALRNERQFGRFIPLRDDVGLELAVANGDDVARQPPAFAAWETRARALHPVYPGRPRTALLAAGGEAAYSAALGAETNAWIAAHPLTFARLCLRHYRQFYLPDTWEIETTEWDSFAIERAAVMRIVAALGTAGLLWSLARRRRGYGWVALYYAAVGLVYALVQPVPRYTYLVWGLQLFLAAGFVRDLAATIAARSPRREPALRVPA